MLAEQARTKGNSPVGSIILHKDQIIAEGAEAATTEKDITRHAEMIAIQQARNLLGRDLSQCTLISTHEPCVMCSYAIRFHRIGTVAFQKQSDYLGGMSSDFPLLSSNDVPPTWGPPPKIVELPI